VKSQPAAAAARPWRRPAPPASTIRAAREAARALAARRVLLAPPAARRPALMVRAAVLSLQAVPSAQLGLAGARRACPPVGLRQRRAERCTAQVLPVVRLTPVLRAYRDMRVLRAQAGVPPAQTLVLRARAGAPRARCKAAVPRGRRTVALGAGQPPAPRARCTAALGAGQPVEPPGRHTAAPPARMAAAAKLRQGTPVIEATWQVCRELCHSVPNCKRRSLAARLICSGAMRASSVARDAQSLAQVVVVRDAGFSLRAEPAARHPQWVGR